MEHYIMKYYAIKSNKEIFYVMAWEAIQTVLFFEEKGNIQTGVSHLVSTAKKFTYVYIAYIHICADLLNMSGKIHN